MGTLEKIRAEIDNYKIKIEEYKNGNVDPNIKGIRSIMGVYGERESESYMLRIKTPGGVIAPAHLSVISKIADKYSHGRIHFTTRQDIQFHGVKLEDTVNIMNEVLELGIDTLGAGGNSARNVACSPLSGVGENEAFDVTSYAVETSKHLLNDPSNLKLPRKYKISFSNNDLDTANATISDLGFIAKLEDGKKGFEVYGAGGLGGSPTIAVKLEDFIEAKEVLYYVEAMKALFEAEGDRENRHKARIRFILYRLGEEKFKETFNQHLKKVRERSNLDLIISEEDKYYEQGGNHSEIESHIVKAQKQKGYYSVFVHTENGYISTEFLNNILGYINSLKYEVDIRLTNTQGFYVRDLRGKDVDVFLDIISKFSSTLPIDETVACVGVTVCGSGLCNSQGLSSAIYERFLEVENHIKSVLPRIFISGCTNSCGQHQIGKIGFSGRAIRGEEGMIPAYRLYFGGIVEKNKTKLGEVKGELPARRIPEFLYNLALLVNDHRYENFNEFLANQGEKVEKLIKEFETFNNDPNLYYDFNSDIKFLTKAHSNK